MATHSFSDQSYDPHHQLGTVPGALAMEHMNVRWEIRIDQANVTMQYRAVVGDQNLRQVRLQDRVVADNANVRHGRAAVSLGRLLAWHAAPIAEDDIPDAAADEKRNPSFVQIHAHHSPAIWLLSLMEIV